MRTIVCPCGHPMTAKDDEQLLRVVRNHVDDVHPDLNYSDGDVEQMIREDAEDVK